MVNTGGDGILYYTSTRDRAIRNDTTLSVIIIPRVFSRIASYKSDVVLLHPKLNGIFDCSRLSP